MPSSSLWLTWLANLALVTSVYPNQMQYAPHVLQEVSLLDGVNAGVCGNGRRFSKTSSYPPCCQYVSLYYLIIPNQPAVASQLNVIRPQQPVATLWLASTFIFTPHHCAFVFADLFISHNPLVVPMVYQSFPCSLLPLIPIVSLLLLNLGTFLFMAEQYS